MQIEFANNTIKITKKQAGDEFLKKMMSLSDKLTELAILLEQKGGKSEKEGILSTIKTWKWVPEFILTLVSLAHTLV